MAKVISTEKKVVAFNLNDTATKKFVNDLANNDIKADVGMLAIMREGVALCAAGKMTPNAENSEALLEAVNDAIRAYRKKHQDPRPVAPINAPRKSEMTSILRLSVYENVWSKLFDTLKGYDIGKKDLVTVSRLMRTSKENGGWEWKTDIKTLPKTREQIFAAIKTNRLGQHGETNGKKKFTVTKTNAIKAAARVKLELEGFKRALVEDDKATRVVIDMLEQLAALKPFVAAFTKAE